MTALPRTTTAAAVTTFAWRLAFNRMSTFAPVAGSKRAAVTPAGNPSISNVTGPLKPPCRSMAMGSVASDPRSTLRALTGSFN